MTHYNVTYSCGHEGEFTAIGSKRSREWAVQSAESGLCPECYQAKITADREAAQAAARAEAEEQELPALEGSEKQVAWALTIRSKWLAAFERYLEGNPLSEKANPLHRARFLQAAELLQREQSAKWWIENGRQTDGMYMQKLLKERFVMLSKIAESGVERVEARLAQSLRPETAITETICTITTEDNTIALTFPERNEQFRALVRDKDYSWDGSRWIRKITARAGTVEDRAAEIANLLLSAGFVVQVYDEAVKAKALSGEFEPECKRWVLVIREDQEKYAGWFAFSWEYGNESIYKAARSIRGSRWSKPYVVVPPEEFEAVIDLAEEHQFKISKSARKLIEAAERGKRAALIVKPTAPKKPEPAPEKEAGGIDATLLDED